jgi:hypothetical protein
MTTVQGHPRSTEPRALYVYRGKNHDLGLLNSRDMSLIDDAPITTHKSKIAPPCSACSAIGERVVGGWWCASCESAI